MPRLHYTLLKIIVITLVLLPREVLAHGAIKPEGPWISWWTYSPLILANIALLAFGYLLGLLRMNRRQRQNLGIGRARIAAFGASIATLVVALVSPVDALSDLLQSMHMIQHTLLMMVAAPLFILGAPAYVTLFALPRRARRVVGRVKRAALAPWNRVLGKTWSLMVLALYALVLWVWHLPSLYEQALADELLHDGVHILFFVSSCLLWSIVFHPLPLQRLDYGAGVAYLFVTSVHSCALGALMALSPKVWYGSYIGRAEQFGLSALEDQSIAGYIMWMPAGFSYIVAAAVLTALWIRRSLEPRIRRKTSAAELRIE